MTGRTAEMGIVTLLPDASAEARAVIRLRPGDVDGRRVLCRAIGVVAAASEGLSSVPEVEASGREVSGSVALPYGPDTLDQVHGRLEVALSAARTVITQEGYRVYQLGRPSSRKEGTEG